MNNFESKKLGNRYILLEKVGDGGMALVYKAKCELLNRYVAVKILRPEFISDEDFVRKFRSESLAVAKLSHPNIVNVYDVGEEDGIYYIVMEYVDGVTLKDYIKKEGKLDYKEALKIVEQIAEALEHAHKNGVIHRDVKPHNILITKDGTVKVTDFGIARAATSSTMTNTNTVMGSVHYVSPEQARGGFIDNRTDIYSLGIVMYELLIGKVPFDGESPISVAIKHIQENIINPSEIDKSIPRAVSDIIVKATEKDPLKRYQTLGEMISDIENALKNPNGNLHVISDASEHTRVIPVDEIEKAINSGATTKINPKDLDDLDEIDDAYDDDYDDDEYESNKKMRIKQKSKTGKKKTALIATISIVAVLMVAIIGGVMAYMSSSPKEVVVPKLVGLKEAEAKQLLEQNKLVPEITVTKSEQEKGTVVSVYPSEGMAVKENSTVKLTISGGVEKVKVPNLKKLTLDEAQNELRNLGLEVGNVSRKYSDTAPKDEVIEQSISSREEVDKGTKVNLVISDGPEEKLSTVPSLTGKTIDAIKAELEKSGLTLGSVRYGTNNKYENNIIIEQSVSPGTKVKQGSTIDIVVNKKETLKPDENKDPSVKPEVKPEVKPDPDKPNVDKPVSGENN